MIVSVVACGDTASEWHKVKCDLSIGVNDAFKFGYPTDYLLCCNWPQKFPAHRLNIIKASRPITFYSNVEQWRAFFPGMVKIRLNSWDGHLYPTRRDEFSSSNSSPFIATSMAYKAGAKDIILWGVEFVNHAVLHKDNPQTKNELRMWKGLVAALNGEGVNVWLGKEGSLLEEFVPVWS